MFLFEKIVGTLPIITALLDRTGNILYVNEEWKKFADENGLKHDNYGIGENYIRICNKAEGKSSENAYEAGEGIQKVLNGTLQSFSVEYPCHSPDVKRWFRLIASSVSDENTFNGVIMHVDITLRVQAEKRYRRLAYRLRNLGNYLEEIRENEKSRISREIQENIGQTLAAVKMISHSIKRNLKKEDLEAFRKLDELNMMVSSLIKTIHEITDSIRPEGLNTLGLIAAMEKHIENFAAKNSLKYSFISAIEDERFNKQVETGTFRMFQESLDFIAAYSDSEKIDADVGLSDQMLHITIRFNGRLSGRTGNAGPVSLAAMGIKERAVSIGGKLRIIRNGNNEAEIRIMVPVNKT